MRRIFFYGLCVVAVCLAVSTAALAGGPDPDNYPLRVHVFRSTAKSRHPYESKQLADNQDYMDGMGVADLFENGQPAGFEFDYGCIGGMTDSGGYGTYPARWKKRGKSLEILLPEKGKPWNLSACELRVEMRAGLVFYWRNGKLAEEGAAVLKAWMTKHQYDPEKDKNDPVMVAGETEGPGGPDDPQIAEP